MSEWAAWGVDRVVVLFTALAYLMIWMQVSLYHWAGGFKHTAMWGPVIVTPLVAAGAVAGAVTREGPWGWIALALLALGVLLGLVGLAYHVRGVQSQIGGFSLRNLLSGPPPVLPAMYAAMGVLGAGALAWNA